MYEKDFEKAKQKAFKLLSYRARTEQEICSRLHRAGFSSEVVERLKDFLEEYGFINDRSFAEQWLKYRLNKGNKGKLYIYRELLSKGVSSEIADELISSISDECEYNIMMESARRKLKTSCSNYALAKYLERQGFSRELICKGLSILFEKK
ncbi:MAG: recombination regulator RecX [Clostridiales bacterium]|nr:recombination regulator RecX [Clostridiales bacterium]MCF8023406.1 recombination regulator RecX [Clostridiales bacterium]